MTEKVTGQEEHARNSIRETDEKYLECPTASLSGWKTEGFQDRARVRGGHRHPASG